MNFQCKSFQKYFVILLVLLFGGCTFFFPIQQIEYSNDPQLKILKNEMNIEDAIRVLRIYIRDVPRHGTVPDMSEQKNTLVNEEGISYDIVNERWECTDSSKEFIKYIQGESYIGRTYTYTFKGRETSPFRIKYSDVRKIKLFDYRHLDNCPSYRVFLYGVSNKWIFCFSVYPHDNQMAPIQSLLSAITILIPHAKEEYDKDKTKLMADPVALRLIGIR